MNGPNKAFVNQKELAFAEDISTQLPGIGSITMGVSSDIGENYHLCNGSIVNPKCQELINLLGNTTERYGDYEVIIDKTTIPENSYLSGFSNIYRINGKCVIRVIYTSNIDHTSHYGFIYAESIFDEFRFVPLNDDFTFAAYDDATNNYVFIHSIIDYPSDKYTISVQYSDNIDGPYTSRKITKIDIVVGQLGGLNKPAVNNGRILSILSVNTSSTQHYRIQIDDYRNSESFTLHQFTEGIVSNLHSDVVYGNGYFCHCYTNASANVVCYYADSDSMTWRNTTFRIYGQNYTTGLCYDQAQQQFCIFEPNSISQVSFIYLHKATVPSQWNEQRITLNSYIQIRNSLGQSAVSCENITYYILTDSAGGDHLVKILENTGTGFVESTMPLLSWYTSSMIGVTANNNMRMTYCENGILVTISAFDGGSKIGYIGTSGKIYPEIDLDNTTNCFIRVQ